MMPRSGCVLLYRRLEEWLVEHEAAVQHLQAYVENGGGAQHFHSFFLGGRSWDSLIVHSLSDIRYRDVTNYLMRLFGERPHPAEVDATRFRDTLTMEHVRDWLSQESRDTLLAMHSRLGQQWRCARLKVMFRWYDMHSLRPPSVH